MLWQTEVMTNLRLRFDHSVPDRYHYIHVQFVFSIRWSNFTLAWVSFIGTMFLWRTPTYTAGATSSVSYSEPSKVRPSPSFEWSSICFPVTDVLSSVLLSRPRSVPTDNSADMMLSAVVLSSLVSSSCFEQVRVACTQSRQWRPVHHFHVYFQCAATMLSKHTSGGYPPTQIVCWFKVEWLIFWVFDDVPPSVGWGPGPLLLPVRPKFKDGIVGNICVHLFGFFTTRQAFVVTMDRFKS